MSTAEGTSGVAISDEIVGFRRFSIMAALIMSTILAAVDSSFVPIAFADMIDKLDTSTSSVVWVALGYLIAATGPQLFMSRLGEVVGQVRLFQIGTVVFSVAMGACAFAPDITTLVILRTIQGFGMAMFMPFTFAIAQQVYPSAQRGTALGILQTANAFGFVLGPVFAGWLLDAFDWRAIFSSRIPLGIIAVVIVLTAFGSRKSLIPIKKRSYYDFWGAAILTFGFLGLLYGLNRLPVEDNHLEWTVWAIFLAGIALFYVFVRHERQSPDPLVNMDLFIKYPEFTKASVAITAMFASFPVQLFIFPLLLITGLEVSAWDTGLIMCVAAAVTAVVSVKAGKLGDQYGAANLCLAGTSLVIISYLMMLFIGIDSSYAIMIASMAVFGLGTGLFFAPNFSLILGSVPREQSSVAQGMIGTLRLSGYAIGFALIASLFTAVQDSYEASLSRFAVGVLPSGIANQVATLYEGGGIWAQEIIVYVFQITIIICSAILLLTLINTVPKLRMNGRRLLLAIGCTTAIGFSATYLYISAFELANDDLASGETSRSKWRSYETVAPFGMASRSVETQERNLSDVDGGVVYVDYCASCHGDNARGLDEQGVDLVRSLFVARENDLALGEFLKVGRAENSPDSVTGELMPEFDYLEPEELTAVIDYLRDINRP